MIQLKTLENTDTATLTKAFNTAFSDYSVPMQISVEQLETKMHTEDIKPEYSVGAFEDNQLVAFILHGYKVCQGQPTLYNAGTGVIPDKRGNKLTFKLYEFILPQLLQQGIKNVILEVITTNKPAICTYTKVGFTIVRELNCYKGHLIETNQKRDSHIVVLNDIDWNWATPFWDWEPTWQNSSKAMANANDACIKLGAFEGDRGIGYLIFNPKSKRVHQLAVDKSYRNQGVATQLLDYIRNQYGPEVSLINVPVTATATLAFWERMGMQKTVSQYEMMLTEESFS
ncbi:GNAT family N-acetyltransferase [Flavobacterium sp.]|uniref:GNAT family N-acetyltransferase n=1 Tax=Flavobacterium sp. TaxID=239 RepID=UPI002FDCE2EF